MPKTRLDPDLKGQGCGAKAGQDLDLTPTLSWRDVFRSGYRSVLDQHTCLFVRPGPRTHLDIPSLEWPAVMRQNCDPLYRFARRFFMQLDPHATSVGNMLLTPINHRHQHWIKIKSLRSKTIFNRAAVFRT